MSRIPDKAYFRIGEVSSVVGVEPHVLRYWEREFPMVRPSKSTRGQRVYSRKDVDALLKVRDLLYGEGFTIAGARRQLRVGGTVEKQPETVHESIEFEARPQEIHFTEQTPAANAEAPTAWRRELTTLRAECLAFLDEISARRRSRG